MEGHAGGEGAGRCEPHGGLGVFFPVRCATTGGQVRVRRLPSPPCVAPGVGSRDVSCRGSSRVERDAEEKALDVVRSHTGWDLGTLGPAVELGWPGTAARSCVASFLVTWAVCWVAVKARRDQAARGSGTAGAGVGPGVSCSFPWRNPSQPGRRLPWAWRPECRRPGAQFCTRGHGGPPPLPRRSLSYRKQLERGHPESHSEMRLVVPGPVLASRPKDPMGTLIWCHVSVPPPGRRDVRWFPREPCVHTPVCVRARSVSVVCGRMGQSQTRAGGFLALLSWAGPALRPRGHGPGQPPPAVTPTCASRCGRVQHEQRQLRPGLRQHQGQLRMRLPPGEAAALEPEGLRG